MWDREKAEQFGSALRALRETRGLSQEQFAYRAGITKNGVQLLERGRGSGAAGSETPSNPTITTLQGLADGFGMSLAELFATLQK